MQSQTDLEEIKLSPAVVPARVMEDIPAALTETAGVPLEVLYSFVSLRGKFSGGRVIAFTSARRKEGVSHAVRQLGRQLAQYCRDDVLIIRPPDLRRLQVLDLEQIEIVGERTAPGLWAVPGDLPELEQNGSTRVQEDLWNVLRARFRYVLFDCSALECSGDVLSLAPRVDGTVLVVRAGFAPKREIQRAARVLSLASTPFLGCILNGRTYPVPGFLYRAL